MRFSSPRRKIKFQVLYQCAHPDAADCLVDLANQSELDAISAAAASFTVDVGTFTTVSISTCVAPFSGSDTTIAKVTGTATGPTNTSWRTDSSTVVDVSGTGTASESTITSWGCSSKNVLIPGGITVTASSTPLTLSVVVDNYLAAAFNQNTSGGEGGCMVFSRGGRVFNGYCVSYPALLAYVGTGSATTRRFSISHDRDSLTPDPTKANALVIVAVTDAGLPLMAYGRLLFSATSEVCAANTYASSILNGSFSVVTGGPNYITETNYATFAVTTGSMVSFEQGGSADTYAAKFASFDTSASSTGNVMSKDGTYTWHYQSTLLP